MVEPAALPADVGVCVRKISDRSDLVVLPFLGARFSRTPARLALGANWASHRGDLSDLGLRECSRGMAVFVYDTAGSFRERGTQNRHAGVRDRHRSHRVRVSSDRTVASRAADWSCRRGPSRLLLESFHAAFGPVSVASGGLRRGNRWNGRGGWRDAHRPKFGVHVAVDGGLPGFLFYCGLCLFGGTHSNPRSEPEAGAGQDRWRGANLNMERTRVIRENVLGDNFQFG